MERYSVVIVRSILGGGKGTGSVLSGGYFEDYCDGKLEGVRPGECDPLGVSYGNEVGTIKGTDGEVLVIKFGVSDRSKPGVDEGSGRGFHVDTLRMLVMETLRVKGMDRVIHWVIQKELGLEIN